MNKKPGRKIITFDWAIKTVLRNKANFDVLEGFLTALFDRPITILDMLEGEGNQQNETDKYNRVDLLAKTGDGERIIVEVQYLPEKAYLRRLVYGTSRTIVEHIKVGEPYGNVRKAYSITLVHFDVSDDGDDYVYHGKTTFTGLHTHKPITLKKSLVGDPIRINETDIFPEYYLITLKRFPDIIRNNLDEWIYAFKNNEVLDEFTAPGIGALKEKFDYRKMDDQERRRFDRHIDYVRSDWGMIQYAREGGHKEGLARGLMESITKKRELGYKEARATE
uniref:PD-(D/E)XK nuclease family transposase n=1 Tax=Candidatus Kentrum sp. DK TaxID=2126562 RepID=A0A450T2A8_9GAMM|nr:MAG: conserved hypothetical protein (putative transposase or invertase) [Candidatus Kentron sp. DK]